MLLCCWPWQKTRREKQNKTQRAAGLQCLSLLDQITVDRPPPGSASWAAISCSHTAPHAPRSLHLVTLCLHCLEIPLRCFNKGPCIFLVREVLASPSFNHAGLTYRKCKKAEISPLNCRTARHSQGWLSVAKKFLFQGQCPSDHGLSFSLLLQLYQVLSWEHITSPAENKLDGNLGAQMACTKIISVQSPSAAWLGMVIGFPRTFSIPFSGRELVGCFGNNVGLGVWRNSIWIFLFHCMHVTWFFGTLKFHF